MCSVYSIPYYYCTILADFVMSHECMLIIILLMIGNEFVRI